MAHFNRRKGSTTALDIVPEQKEAVNVDHECVLQKNDVQRSWWIGKEQDAASRMRGIRLPVYVVVGLHM